MDHPFTFSFFFQLLIYPIELI